MSLIISILSLVIPFVGILVHWLVCLFLGKKIDKVCTECKLPVSSEVPHYCVKRNGEEISISEFLSELDMLVKR